MPGNANTFTCFGASAPCPPNFTPMPIPAPTMPTGAPTSRCDTFGPCPCAFLECFEERDPDSCECTCPFEILLAAHNEDPHICSASGTDSPVTFIESACACDCPLGSRPEGGCPGNQVFNHNTCECGCPNQVYLILSELFLKTI